MMRRCGSLVYFSGPDNRRVRITENEWDNQTDQWPQITDHLYLWDGLVIAEQSSGPNGATVDKRFYPPGVEILTGPDAGTYTYRSDHLGSIREVVDDQGSLSARFDYSPWGEMEAVSGSFGLDFGFTGHFIHQPSGLYLAPFRAYDPGLGRWLSREPLGELGPDGSNLYWYGLNSPVNFFDPTGLWNLWNPLTWGLPRQPGENPWNPVDSSDWGAAAEGAKKGAAAYADGMIFGANPFESSGVYERCESGLGASRLLGKAGGVAASLAGGGLMFQSSVRASTGASLGGYGTQLFGAIGTPSAVAGQGNAAGAAINAWQLTSGLDFANDLLGDPVGGEFGYEESESSCE